MLPSDGTNFPAVASQAINSPSSIGSVLMSTSIKSSILLAPNSVSKLSAVNTVAGTYVSVASSYASTCPSVMPVVSVSNKSFT